MKKKALTILAAVLAVSLVAAGCGNNNNNSDNNNNASGSNNTSGSAVTENDKPQEKVKIEFFQTKNEAAAKDTYDKLIAKFEEANPNIDVEQLNPPNAETVIKTRVATGDVPDVMAMGAADTFATLSKSGVFENFADDAALLDLVQPSYVEMIKKLTGLEDVTGIPYSANANGILYNKKVFAELGLSIPKTWDELVAVCDAIKAAGKMPFYLTVKDSWTVLPAFNSLASNIPGDTFFTDRKAGTTTFKDTYKEVAEKELKLFSYGNKDANGKGYNDGNTAFAKGESVMYLQGVWAIPEIKKANPEIEVGSFPLPATNDPAKNRLVSGVDTLLTIPTGSKHKEEANKFIAFMLQQDSAQQFITEQNSFSAVKGVNQTDPTVVDLSPAFDNGLLVDFADHYIPSAMKLDTLVQELVIKKDVDAFLNKMDKEWDKVAARQ